MSATRYAVPEPIRPRKVYLRRMHPRELVELVILHGDEEIIVQVDNDSLAGICRDANAFYFTGTASWIEMWDKPYEDVPSK